MGEVSRKWIDLHREELRQKYDNKTVIVSEDKIVEVLDGAVSPVEVDEIATEICDDEDWSYTYLCKKDKIKI